MGSRAADQPGPLAKVDAEPRWKRQVAHCGDPYEEIVHPEGVLQPAAGPALIQFRLVVDLESPAQRTTAVAHVRRSQQRCCAMLVSSLTHSVAWFFKRQILRSSTGTDDVRRSRYMLCSRLFDVIRA